ncbi:MFS transporter [Bacillus thermotolerans]|uniref:Alpha-ketoglutarate permease n=1 Tax=Bacillus thermotolerans TaxID=1221996 RepID=A0A0F5HNU9_BACTR|nr:MFS transporter [Bacillus thermotolerans]KKB34933.1 alpha-ketoglutarate permease [Bacillus thermotolerans]KKB40215.1 alpha-ketoglutarate permease [Bacillus thermotolerans]KKB43088.1 alpha-ketoglutarate permease [Bacillus thermotolerans]
MLDRIGIPKKLSWGFLGVMIFMMGDGLEAGWLSPFLIESGLSVQQSAAIFTVYGISIALASWFSSVCLEAFGAKRTMAMGLLFYVIGTAGFIIFGFETMNYPVMLLTYFIKGFGYPLFAYSFLTWLIYRAPKEKLSTAVGWFWFAYCAGMMVLGAWYSSFALEQFGYLTTLWTSIFWVCLGAFFALVMTRDKYERKSTTRKEKLNELLKGITIMKSNPRVAAGGVVRIINSLGTYGFPVFLPLHMAEHGIETTVWLQLWGTIFIGNIVFNLIYGVVGDKFGWKNTIIWFGAVGCAVFTVLLYYTPILTNGNVLLTSIVGFLWGCSLAGYVPIGALVPSVAGEDKGAAMAVLNLGAGLSTFVAPALALAFIGPLGAEGVIWIFSLLHIVSAVIVKFIHVPEDKGTQRKAASLAS